MNYRREIDGLRALAVISVILYHAGFHTFSGGFVGVDIFFVISGFLITTIIYTDIRAGSFSLFKFYERRARRILPALYLVMVVCLPMAWLWLLPGDYKSFSESLIAVSMFSSNLLFCFTSSYFDIATELKPFLHTWSLAVEEQYYVFFPMLLLLTAKLYKSYVAGLLITLAVISLAIAEWGSTYYPTLTFYLLPTRGWELLVGAILALHMTREDRSTRQSGKLFPYLSQISSCVGLILIVYAVVTFDRQTPSPSLWSLLPTLGAALIIAYATPTTLVGRILGNLVFVSIGLISYSAYLWHQPLFSFARYKSLTEPPLWVFLTLIGVVFILAYVTWRYVETPFRNKAILGRQTVVVFSVVGSALFVLIGLAGFLSKGFPGRYNINYETLRPILSDDLQLIDQCFLLNKDADALDIDRCVQNNGHKKYNVLLLGDSHAASIYPGLYSYLDKHNIHLASMTAAYCLPLITSFPKNTSQTATSRCVRINQKIINVIRSNKFDLILVSSFILQWGFRDDMSWTYPNYYRDYLEALKKLQATAKVIVIGQLPVWTKELPGLYLGNSAVHRIEDIPQYTSDAVDKNVFVANKTVMNDMASMRIQYISLTDFLCPHMQCLRYLPSPSGPQLVTFDYGHLGLVASNYLADNLVGPVILEALNKDEKSKDGN